ncbi:MAG: glycosyltransferase [Chloroflexia bacterium]
MRVVLLSAEYPPMEGGVGDYTRRLALALRGEGLEVVILTSAGVGGLPEDDLEVYPGVRDWGWGCLPALVRFLRWSRPEVMHLQYQTGAYRMHPAIHFLPEALHRLPAPPALVVTMHDLRLPYLFPKAGPLRPWVVLHLLRRAAAVVVTNGADRGRLRGAGRPARDLLEALPPGKLSTPLALIPLGSSLPTELPGYDRASWRARLGLRSGEALLGYFGLLHPTKGADLLVEALAGLRRAGRPARLLIVGGGSGSTDPGNVPFARALREHIASEGLEEAVLWSGPCPAEEAAALLRACDLVVLPYRDGASFRRSSLVAALSLGCPVLTTHPQDPAEVALEEGRPALRDGENVALVPPGDGAALASAIAALLDAPERLRRLGEEAGRLGRAFRWEEVGRKTHALYEALLSQAGQEEGRPRRTSRSSRRSRRSRSHR